VSTSHEVNKIFLTGKALSYVSQDKEMEIPEDATSGTLYSYKNPMFATTEDNVNSFVIYERENANTMRIRWERPCFYCVSIKGADYMSRYMNHEGVITRRKNGKWMFKGHQRLYAYQEVKFK
jgi:hypothetical protein